MKILGVTIDVDRVSYVGEVCDFGNSTSGIDLIVDCKNIPLRGSPAGVKGAKTVLDRAVKKALARKQSKLERITVLEKKVSRILAREINEFRKSLKNDSEVDSRSEEELLKTLWMEAQKQKKEPTDAQIRQINRKSSLCKKCGMGRGKIERFVDLYIMECVKSSCPVGTESYSSPEEALKAWNEMNKPEDKPHKIRLINSEENCWECGRSLVIEHHYRNEKGDVYRIRCGDIECASMRGAMTGLYLCIGDLSYQKGWAAISDFRDEYLVKVEAGKISKIQNQANPCWCGSLPVIEAAIGNRYLMVCSDHRNHAKSGIYTSLENVLEDWNKNHA